MSEQQQAFSRAIKHTEDGNFAAALQEFVWLHDHPNPEDPSSEMFRRANGFLAWATLGASYPPAAEKMRAMLEAKKARLQLSPDDKLLGADARAMQAALMTYENH